MRITRILWLAVPVVFLLAVGVAFLGPGRAPKPEVKGRLIIVKADPSDPADVERAHKKIEQAYEYLKNGADFAKVAASTSETISRDQSGDMGWVGKGVLPKELEDVLFQLKPGQFSEIIKDQNSEQVVFRILYVEERRNF